jgi:fido (protein-threonine AMPylation protein)
MVRNEWPSCKQRRLCREYDVTLMTHLPGLHVADYQAIHARMNASRILAIQLVRDSKYPQSAGEFLDTIRTLHSICFQDLPDFAGRFRRDEQGERVWFGAGAHRLEGAKATEIEPRLVTLFERTSVQDYWYSTRGEVAASLAAFLAEFFRIHPFIDGNGRIGRFMIQLACRASNAFEIGQFDDSSRSQRKYIGALQYAHRNAVTDVHHSRNYAVTDPNRHLEAWILAHIEDAPPRWLEEAEPPEP